MMIIIIRSSSSDAATTIICVDTTSIIIIRQSWKWWCDNGRGIIVIRYRTTTIITITSTRWCWYGWWSHRFHCHSFPCGWSHDVCWCLLFGCCLVGFDIYMHGVNKKYILDINVCRVSWICHVVLESYVVCLLWVDVVVVCCCWLWTGV